MKKETWSLVIGISIVLLSSSSGFGSGQIPAKKQERPIAIVGATLHPVSGPNIEGGTIVFDNGRITALGKNIQVPAGAEVIDATGKHVYPGLISSDTYIGLTEIGAVRASNDRSETGRINPNAKAEVAFNPESELIPVTRANGITLAVSSPAGGLISGTSAMMMMDGWTWEDMTFKAPAAMLINWPGMYIAKGEREEERKKSRDASLKEIADAFHDARAYVKAKNAEQQQGVPYHNVDVRWEAMIPVLDGKVPVMVRANDVQQIQAAVAWAAQEKLRLIVLGGQDSWRVTDLLKKNNVAVIVGGTYNLPGHRFDKYDDPFTLPAKLHQAGIQFAIASGDEAAHERSLPYHAACAAGYGLPREEALKAVTLYPAQIFEVADRVGSLEAGKDATLIVTTGNPLEIMSDVTMEFIQGRKIDFTTRHTMLYEKYKEKYRRIKGK